jgi:MFS family permease
MKPSKYAWLLVAVLWVVSLLNYLDRQVIFSVFPLLETELKLSPVELGLLGTAFLWVYGALSPLAGFLAERFGKAQIIFASLLIWSAVTWATAHARTFPELMCARALMGISEACYLPAALALIAQHHGERTRGLATGLHFSGTYIGIVVGGAGGGWVGEHFGWRPIFTILGAFGVAYAVLVRLSVRREPAVAPRPAASGLLEAFVALFRLRGFPALAAIFAATSMANWIAYTWLPLFLYERFARSLTQAGFTATFYLQAGSVGSILLGGWLGDRWIERSPRGRVFAQAVGLGTAAPFLFLGASTTSFLLLIASLVVFGFGRGVFDCNAMPVLCQIADPKLRTTGYGIFNCVGCIAGGAMTAIAGWMKAQVGLSVAFQFAAILLLLSSAGLCGVGFSLQPASADLRGESTTPRQAG